MKYFILLLSGLYKQYKGRFPNFSFFEGTVPDSGTLNVTLTVYHLSRDL